MTQGGITMVITQRFETSYRYDNKIYRGVTRIETWDEPFGSRYRAVIETPPLRGTYGSEAGTIEQALDFLNLAMQAEGADEISFIASRQEAGQ